MENVKNWLMTFPGWEGEAVLTDITRPVVGSLGVFPQGEQTLSSCRDLLGNGVDTCRQVFLLRRVAVPGVAAQNWLKALSNWVSACPGPALGEGVTRWSLGKARLSKTDMTGLATYEAELTAQYEKACPGGEGL